MKLMSSGRTFVAAITRSPSFSRSSSSRITTISPRRTASMMSSTLSKGERCSVSRVVMDRSDRRNGKPTSKRSDALGLAPGAGYALRGSAAVEHALDVAGEHVDFDVDRRADAVAADDRRVPGMRHDVHVEGMPRDRVDRKAHAVDRDRAFPRDVARELGRQLDRDRERARRGCDRDDAADAVDVTAHEMAVERIADAKRGLEVQ